MMTLVKMVTLLSVALMSDITTALNEVKHLSKSVQGGFFRPLVRYWQDIDFEDARFGLRLLHELDSVKFWVFDKKTGVRLGAGDCVVNPTNGKCKARLYPWEKRERHAAMVLAGVATDFGKSADAADEEILKLVLMYLAYTGYKHFCSYINRKIEVPVKTVGKPVPVPEVADARTSDVIKKPKTQANPDVIKKDVNYVWKGYPECVTHQKDCWLVEEHYSTRHTSEGPKKVLVESHWAYAHDKDRPADFVKKARRKRIPLE